VLLEELVHVGIVELEARIEELAVLAGDAIARAAERCVALDRAGLHEVRHLGEVAARMREADGEALGEHFGAPLHAPAAAVRIAD